MTYFFLLFLACSDQKPAKTEVVEAAQTVKFEKFDINAACVKNTDGFQKMFTQYQNQIQTCFANASEKTLDMTVQITNGSVDSIPPNTSSCLKGVMEKWTFDATCSSDLKIKIRPLK